MDKQDECHLDLAGWVERNHALHDAIVSSVTLRREEYYGRGFFSYAAEITFLIPVDIANEKFSEACLLFHDVAKTTLNFDSETIGQLYVNRVEFLESCESNDGQQFCKHIRIIGDRYCSSSGKWEDVILLELAFATCSIKGSDAPNDEKHGGVDEFGK